MAASSDKDSSPTPSGVPDWRRSLGEVGPYLGLGMQIALSMALFIAIGYAIDQWLGILPWGTVSGALIGMASIFYHLVRVVGEMNRTSSARKKKNEGSRGAANNSPDQPADEESMSDT